MNSEMNETVRSYCRRCNKKLITFRATKDWKRKEYHRKCWLLEKEKEMIQNYYKNMEEEDMM